MLDKYKNIKDKVTNTINDSVENVNQMKEKYNDTKNRITDRISNVFKKKRFTDAELKAIDRERNCDSIRLGGISIICICFALGFFAIAAETALEIIGFLIAAAALAGIGIFILSKAKKQKKKWDTYESMINFHGNTSICYIAENLKLSYEQVIEDIQEMISKNFLIGPNAELAPYIDRESGFIVMTHYETGLPLEPPEVTIMKQEAARKAHEAAEKIKNQSDSIKILRRAITEIKDAEVQSALFDMASAVGKIEDRIKQNPALMELDSVEKYHRLHLPKALELVEKFRLRDGNEEVMHHIKEALPICAEAFNNIAEKLYQTEYEEIIIDIDVMKAQFERDGLLNSDFDLDSNFDLNSDIINDSVK